MLDILTTLPGKKRATSSGWHTFNAVCCHHRGHNPDRRQRAGVIFTGEGNWSYNCFNCGFKCGFQIGKHFSGNLKQLLEWCGVDTVQIERWSFESFSHRGLVELYTTRSAPKLPVFKDVELPAGARPLDPLIDGEHIDYLKRRGLTHTSHNFHVVDGETRKRIILPYYYNGLIVGYTSRFYDGRHPKYVSDQQRGYVFNIDKQQKNWSVCILVEGQFDAISIGGCAIMGSKINDEQAELLRSLNRGIIYVPDRDKSGIEAAGRALDLGYTISIPQWGEGVKDVNDAVVKYGKFPTLLSILQNQTSSRILLEMKGKKIYG